jgi:hypothetical protein
VLTAGVLAGCGPADWTTPRTGPTASGTLDADFVPTPTPSPEATFAPPTGSWDEVVPTRGYRVALLTYGDDEPTAAVVTAVEAWAKAVHADLRVVRAQSPADLVPAIVRAMDLRPEVVISAGNALVDPLAVVSANHLDQQFLVVGAELAEPTHNVTAVDWDGASFRGEGLGAASTYDPASFTPERCGAAVRLGVAAVLSGVTGYVLWVD